MLEYVLGFALYQKLFLKEINWQWFSNYETVGAEIRQYVINFI